MGRPKINRIIRTLPNYIYFKPQGVPMKLLNEEVLSVAEYEALRLKHYKGLNQIECAKKMEISQSTFSRILESAHKKLTTCIVEGKAIKIEGGSYGLKKTFLGYGCLDCTHEWQVKLDTELEPEEVSDELLAELLPLPPLKSKFCPKCKSNNLYRLKKEILIDENDQ